MAYETEGNVAFGDVTLRQAPRNDQEWDEFLQRYANDRPDVLERPKPSHGDSDDSLLLVDPRFEATTSSNGAQERTRAEERQRLRSTYEELGYLPGPEPLEASMRKRRRMVMRLGLANVEIEPSKRAVIESFTKLAKVMFNVESAEAAFVTADNALRRVGDSIPPGNINFKIGVCPHYGLDSGAAPTTAIENHDFFHRGPVVLPDLRQDWRFAKNPAVTHPTTPTLFYASVPLIVERSHGEAIDIGTFCLSSSKPKHDFTARDGEMLTQYAALLVKQLQTLQGEQNSKRVGALQMASIEFIRRSVQPEVFRTQDSHTQQQQQRRRSSAEGPGHKPSFDGGLTHKPKHRSSGDSLHKHTANPIVRTLATLSSHGERPKFRTAPRSARQMDVFQPDKEAVLYSDACSTLKAMLGADTVTIVDLSEYHIYIRRASNSKDGPASRTASRDGRPSLQATKEQLSSEFYNSGTVWPPESEPLVHRVPRHSTMSTPGSSDHGPRVLASTANDERDIYDFSSSAAVDLLGDLLKSYLTSRRVWWSRENKADPLGSRIAKFAPADVNTHMILPSLDVGGRAHFAVFASWRSSQPQSLENAGDLQFVRMLCGAVQASLSIKRMRELEQSQISYSNLQAHELRTPTHQLLAITALLRTALQDLATATVSEETTVSTTIQQVRDLLPYLDAIDTAGRTLHDIIDNILSFLELRSKDNPTNKDPSIPSVPTAQHSGAARSLEVMFEDVIQQVSEDQRQVRKLLGRTSGRIETVFEIVPPLLGESLEEDNGGALESALLKILSNAYKFISGDGYVQITVDDIPSLLPPAGYDDMAAFKRVSIKIEDSGKGMDASFLENRLFEPFAKEDPFTPGSGLSVHLAHRIIDLMGGQMAVSSTPGRGSTVYIEIPLPRREITVDSDDSAAPLAGRADQISEGHRVYLAGFDDEDGADYGLRRLGVSLERQFKKLGCVISENAASAGTVVAEGRWEEDKTKLKKLLDTMKNNGLVFLVDDTHSACSSSEKMASERQIEIRRFKKPMTPAVLREILHPDHADAISSAPSSLNTPQSTGEASAVNSPEPVGPNGSTSSTSTLTSATPRNRPTASNIEDTIASLSMGDYFSSRRKSLRRTQPRNRLPSPVSPLTTEQLSASPDQSPYLDSTQPSPVTPVAPASPSVQPTLVVVEDNKINRVILCQMLRGLKAKIIEAVDGVEAVEAFRKLDQPAVILLDINMPRMDGFAACTEFRTIEASEGRKKSWVIAVTALGSESERQRGVMVGIDVWMQKPCGKAVITKAVEEGKMRLQG